MNVGMQDVAAGSLELLTIARAVMSLERQRMCRIEPETRVCHGRKWLRNIDLLPNLGFQLDWRRTCSLRRK